LFLILPIYITVDESLRLPAFFENLSFMVGLEFTTTPCEKDCKLKRPSTANVKKYFFITISMDAN